MITLQQIQELRSRVDTLRLSLIELREENSALKDALQTAREQTGELELRLQAYQQDEEKVQSEFNDMLEELEKDHESSEFPAHQEPQQGEFTPHDQYAHSG